MLLKLSYLFWKYRTFQRFLAESARGRQIQQAVLLKKLRRHADSDFGRRHRFADIRSVDDFRRQIPVTAYQYYEPYIERVKNGEFGAMFGSQTRLLMFALTSSTTAKTKFIPVTDTFFDEYRAGWNLWGLKLYRDHLDLVHKKTLKLGSAWKQFVTPGGTACGNISGKVAETAPWVARSRFVLPAACVNIHKPISKHYVALRIALATNNVGLIGTANPSTLIELARLADVRREDLIRDIHNGTLCDSEEIPAHMREALRPSWSTAQPRRARELESIVEQTGRLDMRAAWPGLSVLAVWMGGSAGVFLPRLKEYYGETALRDHGLSASEGHQAIPMTDGTSSGLLEYVHHFFEFIPVAEHDRPNPIVLQSHELEEGRDYYILLTTSSGLYRYDIHDVVRCDGFVGEVPLVRFVNKGAHFSNITGEKLSESQIIAAVQTAFTELNLPIEAFTVAPVMGERPRYVLMLEPGLHRGREIELAHRVNAELARENCEYENRLETRRLEPLTIEALALGTWSAFRRRRTEERGNFEEFKHPCLVGDLGFVERIRTLELEVAGSSENYSSRDQV